MGRIIERLKGYEPTVRERTLFKQALRAFAYPIILCSTIGGYAGLRFARAKKWTASQYRVATAFSGGLLGSWVGAAAGGRWAASIVRNNEESHIAKVIREEVARERGEIIDAPEDRKEAPSLHPLKNASTVDSSRNPLPLEHENLFDDGDEVWKLPAKEKPQQRRYNQYGDIVE
ncbi:hypothetical protein HDU82_008289 [Entophlyctis luteolus]|nr:hypothetical protein HDU82_008289 [Entophlyctis luteolus]KAJ3377593.1 hypothetical protein HDU84_008502 [Entophlyctis sp. JEL0112]